MSQRECRWAQMQHYLLQVSMKTARRLAKSTQTGSLGRLGGTTLIEAVVTLALLGVMIYAGTTVAQYSSKVTQILRNQSERHRALERIASAVISAQLLVIIGVASAVVTNIASGRLREVRMIELRAQQKHLPEYYATALRQSTA